jgi:hypothetical protein
MSGRRRHRTGARRAALGAWNSARQSNQVIPALAPSLCREAWPACRYQDHPPKCCDQRGIENAVRDESRGMNLFRHNLNPVEPLGQDSGCLAAVNGRGIESSNRVSAIGRGIPGRQRWKVRSLQIHRRGERDEGCTGAYDCLGRPLKLSPARPAQRGARSLTVLPVPCRLPIRPHRHRGPSAHGDNHDQRHPGSVDGWKGARGGHFEYIGCRWRGFEGTREMMGVMYHVAVR